nr:hypothetical protein [Porticoccaceae bacterium]
TTLLLDGDLIAYRIAAALEKPIHWGDGLWTLHCHEDDCNKAFVSQVEGIKKATGLKEVVVAISSPTNYRKDINPLYKANRKATRRPLCLAPLLDFCKEEYNHIILDNIEADDVMGILATQDPDKYLIVSDDKDMLTIPDARIWKDGEVVHITPEEAHEHFITQALKGDPTDGYYGVKGVGEVTARKIIEKHRGSPESLWEGVLKAYKGNAEEAVLNARMARILTSDLWDGAPVLWEPPIII